MTDGVRVGRVATDGDDLYYEVRGSGPPLLMIHGGIVDASSYARAADLLASEFTVITYDRRGYSRSSRRDPQNFEIGQQARDAVAVLHAAGHASAIVVGNSGGAIIGLEMARSHPETVTLLVAHEPPAMRVLPDADAAQTDVARVYLTTWERGADEGLRHFFALNPVPRTEADVAAVSEEARARMRGNVEFFLKQEMLPFAAYMPDCKAIQAHGVPVVMGVGELSREQRHGQVPAFLAEHLACPLVIFPGHHTSFQGMAEEWTTTLRRVMGDGERVAGGG